jgi:hypothetical protein
MRRANVDEAKQHDAFVDEVGFANAERLMQLYSMSYPVGTEYDKLMRTGFYKTKEQVFTNRARSQGFTQRQIALFLELQGF